MSDGPPTPPGQRSICPACGTGCSAVYDKKTDQMLVACAHGVITSCPLDIFAAAMAEVMSR